MGGVILAPEQWTAVSKLSNGKILCGGVGSGKSRTALAYYIIKECGGSLHPPSALPKSFKEIVIITTAKKRDSKEWIDEFKNMGLHDLVLNGTIQVSVDSWNNIQKYQRKIGGFFIFDEQRLVGSGAWVKAFLKIAKQNHWILLSATPGDTWKDYIPVFVANGFYRNKTEFNRRHAVYSRYCTKFPKIERYVGENELLALKESLLVDIDMVKTTNRHIKYLPVSYEEEIFKRTMKTRWNPFEDVPLEDAAQLCYVLRKLVNFNDNRVDALIELYKLHPRLIVFYNFDYELELLRDKFNKLKITYAEWNGHKHENIPDSESWIYLVQYTAGAEGWNCITTDTIVFFSLNYSYKTTEQAMGRIDRRNTPYKDLNYFFLITNSWIDRAIRHALNSKKEFNERRYFTKWRAA